MMDEDQFQRKVISLRAAVWGQAISLMLARIFLAAADAPDYFARASVWGFVLPIAAIATVHVRRVSDFLARSLSAGMLMTFILIVSTSTAIGALGSVFLSFAIPDFLVTPGFEYSRITRLIAFAAFLGALVVNLVLAFRMLRRRRAQSSVSHEAVR